MGSSVSAFSCLKDISSRERITYDMSPVRSKNLPFIWLVGQQNTGKKTQGELIKEKLHFEHISVSDLLRDEARKNTPRGKSIHESLKKHKKVNDFLVIELLKETLLTSKSDRGYLISNFPKNAKQADLFVKEIGNVHFIIYLYADVISLLSRARERSDKEINEAVFKRYISFATRDIKMSLEKFLPKVENVNTSGPPQEVFKKMEDIFSRLLQVNQQNVICAQPTSDPRSGDNEKEGSSERVPQSIITATPNIDPILNNHDLLKSDLQGKNFSSVEVKPIVSHGDSPVVHQNKEKDNDDVEISNESSETLSEDCISKSSSVNNNSLKESNADIAEKVEKVADVLEQDVADSLYS